MKRKQLLILLALLTMLSSIGANAESITGTNLNWELTELTGSEGKYTLTISGSGAIPDFNNANKQPWKASRGNIAALVLGSGVTTIGNYAFNSFTNLESVTIPGNVTSIGNNAFGKCTSLTTVSIPNGVTTIGSSAFNGCTSLEEVTIPNGVKVIPNGAFANCTNLKTVNIPSSVEAIDPGAFNKCTSLENITIPNSVKTIQGTAFQNCTSLKSITIPESVETIGQQAFAGCTSLKKVTILATEIAFNSGVFYNTSEDLVIYVPDGSEDTYRAYGNLQNLNIQPITDPTYTVKLADGTQDAAKWTITSGENSVTGDNADGLTGLNPKDPVTLNYSGRLKVKSVTATTDAVPETTYLKWDAKQEKLVATEIPATAIPVKNADGDVEWEAGTYLVEGNVTINGGIELSGNVELIIKDGAKLNANQIKGGNHSLNIYGQAAMSGELNVACSDGDAISNLSALNIHSCKVNASSLFVTCGGFYGIGELNVYGGSVDAKYTGDSKGYGLCDISSLNIWRGEMKAEGKGTGQYSYGITYWVNVTNVTVYGGKLWVKSADSQALDPSDDVTFTKADSYTNGKIETSDDGETWTVYNGSGKPDTKYVRVGY